MSYYGKFIIANETNNVLLQKYEVILPDIIPVQITPDLVFVNETNRMIIAVNGTADPMNNWLTTDVNVLEQPDLVITAIEASYVSPVGRDINITVHVENIKSELADPFNVNLINNDYMYSYQKVG